MAEHPVAARLREDATAARADFRLYPFPQLRLFKPVRLEPDEADALADVLEAAVESPRCEDEATCECSQARLFRALHRLAGEAR